MRTVIISLFAGAAVAGAQYCGVVTSRVRSFQSCDWTQFPVMDEACTSIGGTVGGHLQETGDATSNCVVYCNNASSGGHDTIGTTSDNLSWHLYVVDSCDSCGYCGGQ